jgi:hypothetical protein
VLLCGCMSPMVVERGECEGDTVRLDACASVLSTPPGSGDGHGGGRHKQHWRR